MPQLLKDLDHAYEGLKASAERNFLKWDILGKPVWSNPERMWKIDTYYGQYMYLRNHLEKRIEWLQHEIIINGYYDYLPE